MVRRGEFCATLKKVRFCGILYVTNDSFKCYIKVGEPMGENKTPQELDFERKHEEYLHRIQNLRLIDDNFMTKVFEDKECSEFLLQVILDRDDLTIREVHSQYGLNNIQGRSARLDILAVDEQNKAYNIEIQRNDRGGVERGDSKAQRSRHQGESLRIADGERGPLLRRIAKGTQGGAQGIAIRASQKLDASLLGLALHEQHGREGVARHDHAGISEIAELGLRLVHVLVTHTQGDLRRQLNRSLILAPIFRV